MPVQKIEQVQPPENCLPECHSNWPRCQEQVLLEIAKYRQSGAALLQTHDALRQFANYLENSREEERKRLAAEIHDKVGQNLLALRIDVSMLHARTIDTHPRINGKADTVLNDLDVAIQHVRDIINHLQPPVLELGLLASLEWKLRDFETYSKIPCSLYICGDERDYLAYDDYATPMMRILQESLTNISRHANASAIDVALSCAQHTLTMTVADDGVGFDLSNLKKTNAYGLTGMRESIKMLNGNFEIGNNPQQNGTVMTVSIPQNKIKAHNKN